MYLMFVMNLSAVWLVLTIGILNLHHNASSSRPPSWLRFLARRASPRIFCVKKHSAAGGPDSDARNSETEAALQENKSQENVQSEWILLGRVLDRVCLIVFTVIDVLAFVILLFFCPLSNPPHPKHFARNETEWRL